MPVRASGGVAAGELRGVSARHAPFDGVSEAVDHSVSPGDTVGRAVAAVQGIKVAQQHRGSGAQLVKVLGEYGTLASCTAQDLAALRCGAHDCTAQKVPT